MDGSRSGLLGISLRGLPLPIFLVVFLLGCEAGSGKESVEGAVSYQGSPLIRGLIEFEPASTEQQQSQSSAVIVNGSYNIPAKHGLWPGQYLVRINSAEIPQKELTKVAPGDESGKGKSGSKIRPRIIPPNYNRMTTLSAEIVKGIANQANFDLE